MYYKWTMHLNIFAKNWNWIKPDTNFLMSLIIILKLPLVEHYFLQCNFYSNIHLSTVWINEIWNSPGFWFQSGQLKSSSLYDEEILFSTHQSINFACKMNLTFMATLLKAISAHPIPSHPRPSHHSVFSWQFL